MSSITTTIGSFVEGRIDFVGQQHVDLFSRFVLIGATIISFFTGFALQSMAATWTIYGVSVALLALFVFPPWPVFNRYPVQWLPVITPKKDADAKQGQDS